MESKSIESKKDNNTKIIQYPKKPARGVPLKKSVNIICNLKQISFKEALKGKHIMIYEISFIPEITNEKENNNLKKKILKQLKEDLFGIFENYYLIGNTIFVCTKKCKEKITLETKLDEIEYQVIFNKISNNLDCSKIIHKTQNDIRTKFFVENIIKNIITANNHIIKFSDGAFYDYYDIESVPFKKRYKIWNGYNTNVLITERGLLLQIIDKKIIITGLTAYEKIIEISKKYNNDYKNENSKKEIMAFFKGRTLITQYGNYRSYKIGDIDFDRNVDNTSFNFEEKDGTQRTITIKEYYLNQYKIKFKYDEQPLFIEENKNEKNSKVKYLIPELLYITGNEEFDSKEKEDFFLMNKKMNTPNEKINKLKKGINYLSNKEKKTIIKNGENLEFPSPSDITLQWGINFSENFLELNAALLSLPQIKFFSQNFEDIKLINNKFKIKKVLTPINFDEKNCLLLTFKNLVSTAKNDCEQITKSAQAFGLQFSLPKLHIIEHTNKNELILDLEKINFNDGKKMAIIVLDDKTKNLYPIIKDYIYSQAGIASQCMLHDEQLRPNINKFSMSYYSAVLNQMVVKAQGELFEIKFCDKLVKGKSMIIGIEYSKFKDVIKYHISASYNENLNKFYTDGKSVNVKENTVDTLLLLLKNALDFYSQKNKNTLPNTVIIYREGIYNDLSNDKFVKNEIIELEKFFGGNYQENYKPNLTVFNVNKKTNLKFFQKLEKNEYKSVPIGTCIDEEVVTPDVFEFYLQSMEYEKGIYIPVQYLCLFNNNEELTMTDFEEITFNQSYYRWNSNGPSKIPVALANAEEANRYCSKYLTHDVLPCLKNSPYFI